MSLKNILAWLGGNLLLRLLPETVGVGHICIISIVSRTEKSFEDLKKIIT